MRGPSTLHGVTNQSPPLLWPPELPGSQSLPGTSDPLPLPELHLPPFVSPANAGAAVPIVSALTISATVTRRVVFRTCSPPLDVSVCYAAGPYPTILTAPFCVWT